ncbi:MAG: hypothetical protein IIC70_07965 [Acidobacteria bacterium]|nr:hypothetical protein [Acidobacteriota bacterium]
MTTDRATWGRGGRIRIDSVTVTPIEWLSSAVDVVIVVGTSISLITA